jgi:CubicO group peptidase (beta-lactamase class C family)
MTPTFAAARAVLTRAVQERAFPAAVVEVGGATQTLWREAFGRLTFADDASPATESTIFDLASLTKVLCAALLVAQDVERGRLAFDDRVALHVPGWAGADRSQVTIRDLLAHCSGLPAHRPWFREHAGRLAYEKVICEIDLEYSPRTRSIYSDLGFMLLGFVLESSAPLAARFDAIKSQIAVGQDLQFLPPPVWQRRTAPTQHDPWRDRLLVGEVDDENAAALGGVAGHAGLFGTAAAVGDFARHILQVLDGRAGAFRTETLETMVTRRTDVPGSSRALGWDTMLPTSSCGRLMSPRSFGHTGFTGTSLWIDPDRKIYVVLLTNRVYPDRRNDAILRVRPAVHDAVFEELLAGTSAKSID